MNWKPALSLKPRVLVVLFRTAVHIDFARALFEHKGSNAKNNQARKEQDCHACARTKNEVKEGIHAYVLLSCAAGV